MPIIQEHLDDNGFFFKGTGQVEGADLIRITKERYDDTDTFQVLDYVFCDFSEITKLNITTEQIVNWARISLMYHEINPHYRIAVHVTSDLIFGLSRMWVSTLGERGPATFLSKDRDKCIQWIKEELGRTILLH